MADSLDVDAVTVQAVKHLNAADAEIARLRDRADEATARAEAAEAKLAAVEEKCRKHAEMVSLHCPDIGGYPAEALVKAADILNIIDGEEKEAER
jgi:alkylation response protein AidB-like acyl-CoA dehydrogenase